MAGLEDKYDGALLGVLQNEGQIDKFLDVIFGFLYRRTDFYLLMKSKQDKMGFPPGVAEKLVLSVYRKYVQMAQQNVEMKENRKKKEERKKAEEKLEASVPVSNDSETKHPTNSPENDTSPIDGESSEPMKTAVTDSTEQVNSGHSDSVAANLPEQSDQPSASKDSDGTGGEQKDKRSGEEDEDPEMTRLQKQYQENPESYNGAVRENYSWSQSITDLDVRIKVPKYICKGRDVQVDIGNKHLRMAHKDEAGQWTEVVNGDLVWDVHKEECIWSLVPGEHVHVNLDKKEERWWEALITTEPKISVRKIDASRPMNDLDDEAQAKIEEMMYNDRQKKMGLPQSHEQKYHEMLKNAWDAEGSPFKGQPFDPSKLKVDPSGICRIDPDPNS